MRRLFIVGNDAFIVHAMRLALRYSSGVNLFGVIDGRRSVRDAVREAQPDIVVVDGLRDADAGIAHVNEIREAAPQAMVLLLSAPLEHPALHEVLEAGAMVLSAAMRGATPAPVVDRPAAAPAAAPVADLASVNGRATNGSPAASPDPEPAPARVEHRCPLTPRELEILRAVAEGNTNARIGRQLWVTEQTVKFHLSNIYRKLGVSNRTEASRYALVNGLVALPGHGAGARSADDGRVRRLVTQAG
ncbi:MAG TPA: response regulator transcription factor [Solirubrobacteraceae bacterium]|nr:response regulator transcription factor [Solirubrobacteraceae bacterium]